MGLRVVELGFGLRHRTAEIVGWNSHDWPSALQTSTLTKHVSPSKESEIYSRPPLSSNVTRQVSKITARTTHRRSDANQGSR